MKKIVCLAFVLVLLSTAVIVRFVGPVAAQRTIYIRADGSIEGTDKIQRDGDVYTFADNIYDEIVVERDDIVVDGAGYTVQGAGKWAGIGERGIALSGRSNVTVKNMKIKEFGYGIIGLGGSSNNTISGNSITSNFIGIRFDGGSNTVSGNQITNSNIGIYLDFSNNTVSGNHITNNTFGIRLYGGSGNSISGNDITNNSRGILFHGSDNSISGNNITENSIYGIYLFHSNNNVLTGNTVSNNFNGIWFRSSSNDNVLFHNNFINNTFQASVTTGCINMWDDGYPSGGNYWSDFEERYPDAEEIDDSGIWKTPYFVDEDNQDNYPLMNPWTPGEETPPPEEEREEVPFWMQWWLWAIVSVVIVLLAGAVYFLKKGKPPTPTAPPPSTEDTLQSNTQNINILTIFFLSFFCQFLTN